MHSIIEQTNVYTQAEAIILLKNPLMWWGAVCIILKTSEAFFVVCLDTDVESNDDKMAQTIHNSIGTTLHCRPSTDADIIASMQRTQAQGCFSIKFDRNAQTFRATAWYCIINNFELNQMVCYFAVCDR